MVPSLIPPSVQVAFALWADRFQDGQRVLADLAFEQPTLFERWGDVGNRWDPKRWPNFMPAELACNCACRFCQMSYYHDPAFLDRLQALRTAIGKPLRINSGHRCARWNAAVGGSARSTHKSIAADIALRNHDLAELYFAARAAGFNGVGFGRTFLHVDTRPKGAAWSYGPAAAAVWEPIGLKTTASGRAVTELPKLNNV